MSRKPLSYRRIQNWVCHRILGRVLFQTNQDFYDRPSLFKKIRRDFNQAVNEKGCQTPFIFTPRECSEFWAGVDNSSRSTGNRPESYAQKNNAILHFLKDFWTPEVPVSSSILELGCNCGANLYWLSQFGYKDVRGVEISPGAISHMRQVFPELSQTARIYEGDLTAILPQMESRSVDMVFTMGVSMHIHPKNNFVFREMARVTRKFICTVEPEASNSNYVFARNYRRMFRRFGVSQLKSTLIYGDGFSHIKNYAGLTARLFTVSQNPN